MSFSKKENSHRIGNGKVVEGKKGGRTAEPRRCLKIMPEGTRLVRRAGGEREEERVERLNSLAEIEAREGVSSCVSQMAVLEKFNSVEGEMRNMNEDHFRLMVSL